MFYGAMIWDPWLIVAQIVCLQCLNYLSLGLLLWLLVGFQVPKFTLKYLFSYKLFSLNTFVGWCTVLAFFLNTLAGAGYLLLIVERTKKCLDFAATMYIINLFFCFAYDGMPATLLWWITNAICLGMMTILGEWLCMGREQRDIPISNSSSSRNLKSSRSVSL